MEIMEINRTIQDFRYTDNITALIEALNDFMTKLGKERLKTATEIRSVVYSALLMNGCRGDVIPGTEKENVTFAFKTRKSVFFTGIDIGKTAEEIIAERRNIDFDTRYFEDGRNAYLLGLSFSEKNRQFTQWKTERVTAEETENSLHSLS